jgi:flagellar biosynthesis/type III secretory pathway M-ring protein FliF/YscJ
VKRTETINDETVDSVSQNENGGVPGVQTNAATGETNIVAATSSPGTSNRTRKKVTNNHYEINKTTSTLAQSAGGMNRISAAVFVAQQFTGKGTNRVAEARKPEDLEKLKRIVQSALGAREGADSKDVITLEEVPFNDTQAVELTKQLVTQEKREMWLGLGRTLLYPGLALALVAFFWRAFKQTPNENIPVGVPIGETELPSRKKRDPGVVSVEVMNQLIRENPDNMTQAIRGWMTTGAAKQNKN